MGTGVFVCKRCLELTGWGEFMKKLIVYLFSSVLILILVLQYAIDMIVGGIFEDKIYSYYTSLVRGPVTMISTDLESLPEKEWEKYIARTQKLFDYPITLNRFTELSIPKYKKKILRTGEIVYFQDGDFFRKRVGKSGFALTMGPFPLMDSESLIDIIGWILAVVSMISFSSLWAVVLWKNFRKISHAATLLGNGNLDTRINVPKSSYFHPIAHSFNQMADRIKQLSRSHKELTNNIAHELRTPLSRMRFSLEMMEPVITDSTAAKHIRGIHQDVHELDDLIAELLTYAGFDRGSWKPRLTEIDIQEWFSHLDEGFRLENNPVIIDFQTSELTPPPSVVMDVKMIERAVSNLIQNANKYAQGNVIISLFVHGQMVCISVDDDGPGIHRDDRERIFEPFSRLDNSRTKSTGGFGLGLSIVKQIADSHHGQISVDDSELGGACFILKLPLV